MINGTRYKHVKKIQKIRIEKNKCSKILRRIRKRNTIYSNDSTMLSYGDKRYIGWRPMEIIELFNKKFKQNFLRGLFKAHSVSAGRYTYIVPKEFSFIDNPDATIKSLRELYSVLIDDKINHVNIDYKQCTTFDLSASAFMDLILLSVAYKRKQSHKKFTWFGQVDRSQNKIVELLNVSGIINHIRKRDIKLPYIDKMDILPNGSSTKVGTKFIEYIDKCLDRQGYQLSMSGRNKMADLVGEVIDNCRDHSNGQWFILGHCDSSTDCSELDIVIYDIGRTIAEGFRTENNKALISKAEKMSNNIINSNTLITLYSLQENVSRLKDVDNNIALDRGTGTAKLIEAFQILGKAGIYKVPQMSIVSGNSVILFNGRYHFKKNEKFDNRRIIAFNDDNDLNKLPDLTCVRNLKEYFPGTMIAIKMYLNKEHLTLIKFNKRCG